MESRTTAECSCTQTMKAPKPVATLSVAPVLRSGRAVAPLSRLGHVARCRCSTTHRAVACPRRRSASPAAAVRQLQSPVPPRPPPWPCALSRRHVPLHPLPPFASCSRPTSVCLARVALTAALLEPSGEREREMNRTIRRGATGRDKRKEEGKKKRKKEREKKKKGKDKTEIRKINEIRLWSNKRKDVS
jgi:hypothetical protein